METLVQKIEFENCKNKIKFVIDEYFKSINKIPQNAFFYPYFTLIYIYF